MIGKCGNLLLCIFAWCCSVCFSATTLLFTEYLDSANLVSISWGFDNNGGPITIQVVANTTGWVGFGFSPSGSMTGSDVVIGGVNPDGTVYFADRHATGNTLPLVDAKQDYTLIDLKESGSTTTMTFSRQLQTCDTDDLPITATPMILIYAYGSNDIISYHGASRGVKVINLLNYAGSVQSAVNYSYFDLTATNFTVPNLTTFYYCKIVQLPSFSQKNHIIRIDPLIQKGNEDLVHHMVLYACPFDKMIYLDGDCYFGPNSTTFYLCQVVFAAWAVGGGAFEFPANVGISVGTSQDPLYFRLEMHYNNPLATSGRVDSSGLRFYYTPQVRQYDAGILETGVDVDQKYVIPPGANIFKSYGLCKTNIFPSLLSGPVSDLNVFASLLHTHLAGVAIRVGHFRNKTQIGFLGVNENYDFSLQRPILLGQTAVVTVGDEIVVECTYNTTNRKNVTTMGLSTTNEMCLAFLMYYPRNAIANCNSVPMVIYNSSIMSQTPSNWSNNSIASFQQLLKTSTQTVIVINLTAGVNVQEGSILDMQPSLVAECKSIPIGHGNSVLNNYCSLLYLILLIVVIYYLEEIL
ncbi:DBH-like monooxygenase protein 2 homolog [Erpetoichthys calabaricus]|uniref:DBH-like monooxygenase protein 2 homolog n=1 Tax=Erpetoichthys calabaricus TaxID=27687 RepID=A0A8C4S9A1_ERPCA|nr:DBH-like monooxygenase protein 2 homolog [Erpetoichthys calabaricus]